MDNQDKKRQVIIDSAVKRFAHYGLAKTTMTEIASDLSLSKALLYYYFPDKISLYSAVLESIVYEIDGELRKGVETIKDTHKALFYVLEKRQEYILKYYNILDYIRVSGPDLSSNILKTIENAKSLEIKIVTEIFQRGIDSNELHISNAAEAADLLMDALVGMRYIAFSNKQVFQLPADQFKTLLSRQKKLATIYLKGLH